MQLKCYGLTRSSFTDINSSPPESPAVLKDLKDLSGSLVMRISNHPPGTPVLVPTSDGTGCWRWLLSGKAVRSRRPRLAATATAASGQESTPLCAALLHVWSGTFSLGSAQDIGSQNMQQGDRISVKVGDNE